MELRLHVLGLRHLLGISGGEMRQLLAWRDLLPLVLEQDTL